MYCRSLFGLISFAYCVVWPYFFCPLCCLALFLLPIVLSGLISFAHCVVWPYFVCPLCCLALFLLPIVLSGLISFAHCVVWPYFFCPLCCLAFDLRIISTLWHLQILLSDDYIVKIFVRPFSSVATIYAYITIIYDILSLHMYITGKLNLCYVCVHY